MDTTNKNPQFIQGYWRNQDKKEQIKAEDGNVIIGMGLLVIAAVVAIIMLWQVALAVSLSVGAGVGANKYFQYKNDPERLVINRY